MSLENINKEKMDLDFCVNEETASRVKKILGGHYLRLYSFFCHYFFKFESNTYTVLLVRRCSVVAMWFFRLICNRLKASIEKDYEIVYTEEDGLLSIRNKHTDFVNIIIDDKFLESGYVFDKSFSYVVVDDICIHGRHINDVAQIVQTVATKDGSTKKVSVTRAVYMKCADSIFKDVDEWWIETKGCAWKQLSNAFVDAINFVNIPYVSHIHSINFYGVKISIFEKLVEYIEKFQSLLLQEYSTDRQLSVGKRTIFIYENGEHLARHEKVKCIRLYYNEKSHILSFVPYVVLGQINKRDIKKIFYTYFSSVSQSVEDRYASMGGQYKYRLLNCVASFSYGIEFAKKYLPDILGVAENDDYSLLRLTFGGKISEALTKKENYIIRTDELIDQTITDAKLDSYDAGADENRRAIIGDAERIIRKKLATLWVQNEVNACYLQETEPKLDLVKQIAAVLKGKTEKKEDLSLGMFLKLIPIIELCDTGIANVSVEESGDKRGYANYLDVGELGINLIVDLSLLDDDARQATRILRRISNYYGSIFN